MLNIEGVWDFIKYLHEYRDPQNKRLISKETRKNKVTAVKVFCRFLYQNSLINENLAEKIKLPKANKSITKIILQPDEVAAIANQTAYRGDKGKRDCAILAAAFSCGFRRSDIKNLMVGGINAKDNLLFIPKGKGGTDRIVPIANDALSLVLYYKKHIRSKFINHESGDYLFLDNKGKQYRRGQITAMINRYKYRAGVTKPGATNLYRHTAATTLLNNGASLPTIQSILGHADISTTQGYIQVAVQKMSEDYHAFHPAVQNPTLFVPFNHPNAQ
jgi:integrase/recombinase XerD